MLRTYVRIVLLIFLLSVHNIVFADVLIGEINKDEFKINRPKVVDAVSKMPISGAKVTIPSENKMSETNQEGFFKITPSSNKPLILSVTKDGYRPFSLTITDGKLSSGILLEMKKITPLNIVVSNEFLHLGDNSYSENSSGACQIHSPCVGPSFSKNFKVGQINSNSKAYVFIGSIIGIDTIQAMKLGQNNLSSATSSPVEIFVNKTKIGELKINGDNQKVPIPTKLLKPMSLNNITVKTGVNKAVKDYIDYDDVQIMNLIVDIIN